ncbi:MAG: hypothetical protein EBR27_11720 [Betaproteobacteria bacterium]|nr:hypothetical protein [Betaproteobacteria bacterium]
MQDLKIFIPALQQALDAQQFDAVLQALAVDAVARAGLATDQGNLTGSAELDRMCAQTATAIAQAHPDPQPAAPVDKDLTIYIATDLYWGHGGHTPLLMDLIKVDKSPRKELLLTVIGGGSKGGAFAQQLTQALPLGVGSQQLTADTLLQKVLILRSYLRAKRPGRIILVTHQYDTVVYCGLTAECAPQIINIYHADTFTLGLHIPWYIERAALPYWRFERRPARCHGAAHRCIRAGCLAIHLCGSGSQSVGLSETESDSPVHFVLPGVWAQGPGRNQRLRHSDPDV